MRTVPGTSEYFVPLEEAIRASLLPQFSMDTSATIVKENFSRYPIVSVVLELLSQQKDAIKSSRLHTPLHERWYKWLKNKAVNPKQRFKQIRTRRLERYNNRSERNWHM